MGNTITKGAEAVPTMQKPVLEQGTGAGGEGMTRILKVKIHTAYECPFHKYDEDIGWHCIYFVGEKTECEHTAVFPYGCPLEEE